MEHQAQMPMALSSQQQKFLRGLAHALKPVVLVGKNGLSADVLAAIEDALEAHELIKVKFIETKDKSRKQALAAEVCRATGCGQAGLIGHTAIFYRPAPQPSKRRIALP